MSIREALINSSPRRKPVSSASSFLDSGFRWNDGLGASQRFFRLRHAAQAGLTLIELIVFIIVISVGVVGLVSVIGPMVRTSADPMVTKQLTAIAESLLNEALHQPYTWCDPDDTAASTALSYASCSNPQNTVGPVPAGESRGNSTPGAGFDNVADYGGFTMNNVGDAAGNNVMTDYQASIAVAQAGTSFGLTDNSAALSVTVTVSRNNETFSLTGYRFRYAPRI